MSQKQIKDKLLIVTFFVVAIVSLLQIRYLGIGNSQKSLSSFPGNFYAGEIHYARIPVQYWEHRILMIKAMGLNSLSIYVMWNYHEIQRGKFDYRTQNRNLDLFLNLAQRHNMNVLLRPGPYVCAQWDFGGLPVRLLAIENIRIREYNKQFFNEVRYYFKSLAPIIKRHLKTRANPEGSIILLQIQNQYGSYGSDKFYNHQLREIWSQLGIRCEFYHQDGPLQSKDSHWKGAHIGISGASSQKDFQYAKKLQQPGVIFGGQVYTGWLNHWGNKWFVSPVESVLKKFQFLLQNNYSFAMYMAHGGTNFGLTAGANSNDNNVTDYKSHITSYDYDAPINEQGRPTVKYEAMKKLLSNYISWKAPQTPQPIETINITNIQLDPIATMISNLGEPQLKNQSKLYHFQSPQLKMFNQGFVVYQTFLNKKFYQFSLVVRDFAIIFIDSKYLISLDRTQKTNQTFSVDCLNQVCNMKIVVEAMGHINYGMQMMTDIKGIFNFTSKSNQKFIWKINKIPIDSQIFKWTNIKRVGFPQITLLNGEFNLDQVGDTFLDLSQFNKGYLFVNGRNLGRYWKKGPQKRLYCPGVWLKTGSNTITVLELLYDGQKKKITGKQKLNDY